MDRANIALLDPRDEAARRERVDQDLLAARFCPSRMAPWRGCKAVVTWAPDGCSYASEHADEQIARWAGFRALAEENEDQDGKREPVWMGTKLTARGTYVAQFEVARVE